VGLPPKERKAKASKNAESKVKVGEGEFRKWNGRGVGKLVNAEEDREWKQEEKQKKEHQKSMTTSRPSILNRSEYWTKRAANDWETRATTVMQKQFQTQTPANECHVGTISFRCRQRHAVRNIIFLPRNSPS
jgi:hypothetical protein